MKIKSIKKSNKKIIVKNFIDHFRNRYNFLSKIIQNNNKLNNLLSINKLSKEKEYISIIGMIKDKKITKKGHLMLIVEDLTGVANIIIPLFKQQLFKQSLDISLDSVIGFSGIGNSNIIFIENIFFPEAKLNERKKTNDDESAIFIGDLHFGSKNFLKKEFLKFIEYLNEDNNIKYLFIVGDLVAGIGVYPNQENELEINDLKKQFDELSKYIKKIKKDIQIIISTGNHDGIRLMEPQPKINKKYSESIYNLENVTMLENPSTVKIKNLDILLYHGFSFPYFSNNIESLTNSDAMNNPEKIMKYLLKNRHLAPTNISNQYLPSEDDKLLIKIIPDIFVCGHTHKSSISYENNILLISVSSWEKLTKYQKKMGNKPDFAIIPLINLKTRAVKILNFMENNEQ